MRTKEALNPSKPAIVRSTTLPSGDVLHEFNRPLDMGEIDSLRNTSPPPVQIPSDPLDALASGPLKDVIAAMLWVNRHNEPEMAVQITDRDLAGFRACIEYLHVTPDVRIVRPQGLPGHEGMPATKTRSAIPPQGPTPPKPYVSIALVEKNTENKIVPVENNEADFAAAQEAKEFKRARDTALQIAGQLQRDLATGTWSNNTVDEAIRCLVALAK